MKYMTFTSSCSYCALANLLELFSLNLDGKSYEDRDIALEIGLPFIFTYSKDSGFYAGAMNQGGIYFNSFLKKFGYSFQEEKVTCKEVVSFLQSHSYSMLGIPSSKGKHAVLYLGNQDDKLKFLNPHRQNDGQPDEIYLSAEWLESELASITTIGYLKKGTISFEPPSFSFFLSVLEEYQKQVKNFCSVLRTKAEILQKKDYLFRAFAVDLLAMMELLGETKLVSLLKKFQQQVLQLCKVEQAIPFQWIDEAGFDQCVQEYKYIFLQWQNRGDF